MLGGRGESRAESAQRAVGAQQRCIVDGVALPAPLSGPLPLAVRQAGCPLSYQQEQMLVLQHAQPSVPAACR